MALHLLSPDFSPSWYLAAVGYDLDKVRRRTDDWNKLLLEKISEFLQTVPDANIVVFSSHTLLADILDRPNEYSDFEVSDVTKEAGRIWSDDCHISSAVNEIIALRLLEKAQ